ncbi:MAG: hypothetical protein US54_C0039G0006 [Candidatus Roizmanbacteria bacterium GW2011_GWA2_37_7]|uniref:Uncharacterized protein n=1 Tax=Candidatus Roizmanbacteria bacterium GW2011_GWA2_37_7 TaxID=1618481 RepID=A0A0G0HFG9_9BACT|nr:MAG: hypothetical protein US54_C0039G0006 [Candidatus Roizmanbacteria bacterium GW2011_GWA2_37_7]
MPKQSTEEKLNYTSSKSDIWKAYKEAFAILENKEASQSHVAMKEITKANNILKESLVRLKSQIVGQLDSSLSDLAQRFDQAEEMLVDLKQAIAKQRKQLEEEEYTYEFTKRKQRQEAELKDQKNIADAEITEGKTELKKQQGELADLRKQVETFDARLAIEIKKTKEETEKDMQMQYEHEKALSSQKYESHQTLLQQKIDSLVDTVKAQQQEIVRLNRMLADANVQVTSIAEKAVSQKYIAPTTGTEHNSHV